MTNLLVKMSSIRKPSGAKKRRVKRDRIIKELASRPGQQKISNLFLKSVGTLCQEKAIDSACSENDNGQGFMVSIEKNTRYHFHHFVKCAKLYYAVFSF